jgi:protease-4
MRQIVAVVLGVVLAMAALGGAFTAGLMTGLALDTVSGAATRIGVGLPERVLSGVGPNKIAVIRLVGAITREDATLFGGMASSRRIVSLLDRAERDASVKAIILELDTPGGGVMASNEIYEKIQAVRGAGKVVVALMTEVAASGGYYVAAGADRIIADPTTITGSIGVIVALANIQEFSRKIGIQTIIFKSGELKDLGSPTRPITPQEAAIFQRLVDEAHARFVGIVARHRNLDRARALRLADGRIYTGQQARRLGLVDSLGHFPDAVEAAKQRAGITDAQIVEYGPDGFLRTLLGSSGWALRAWLGGPMALYPDADRPFSLQYLMVR